MLKLHAITDPYSLLLWGQGSGNTKEAFRVAGKPDGSKQSEKAQLPPWAVDAAVLSARLATEFCSAFASGTPEQVPLWFSTVSGLPLPQDGSPETTSERIHWSVPMLRFQNDGKADLLRGVAAEPPPGVFIGPSLMGWSALMCLAFDLVAKGWIMPAYRVRSQFVETSWKAFPSQRDQLLIDEVAQAMPKWSWKGFTTAGQDGVLDAAAVAAAVLDLYTFQTMRRAINEGTFWMRPKPSEEELRLQARVHKYIKLGYTNALLKILAEHEELYLYILLME